MFRIILIALLSFSFLPAKAIELPKDTKIKIEYLSQESNQLDKALNIRVKKALKLKDHNGEKILVIPEGTKGQLQITRLGGINNDIVMDSKAFLKLKSGKKIDLVHYKSARKKSRKVLKIAKVATALNPIGAVSTAASIAIKRNINEYNLPKKMFVKESIEISLDH